MTTDHPLRRAAAAGALLTTATLALVPVTDGAAGASTCPTGPWPSSVEGRPAAHTDAEGVYLWHSSRGWHLRVNEPGADRAVFTGSVRVDGRIVSIGRHLENAGEGIVYPSTAGVVGFRFVNYGGVDGLDFVTRCASTVEVRVKVGGATVDADHVFIGADGHHPDAVPTSVGRA